MPVSLTATERSALRVLYTGGPMAASSVGAAMIWAKPRRGRTVSASGGGDYAAQMLLGRLRKRGLVRVQSGTGSSVWEITPAGGAALRAAAPGTNYG